MLSYIISGDTVKYSIKITTIINNLLRDSNGFKAAAKCNISVMDLQCGFSI